MQSLKFKHQHRPKKKKKRPPVLLGFDHYSILTLLKIQKAKSSCVWCHISIILAALQTEMGWGVQFKGSPGRNFSRPHPSQLKLCVMVHAYHISVVWEVQIGGLWCRLAKV
jgi:hypothetical protein